jgi:hypothetical protein
LSWRHTPGVDIGYEVVPLETLQCCQYLVPTWGQRDYEHHASVLLEHISDQL